MRLVTSDAHSLKGAIAAVLHGAGWQRCRVHFVRNALSTVPKSAQEMVARRSVPPSCSQMPRVRVSSGEGVGLLPPAFPASIGLMDEAEADVLAYLDFPKEHWRQIWSTNPFGP